MNVCNFKLTRQIQANTIYRIFKMFTLMTSVPDMVKERNEQGPTVIFFRGVMEGVLSVPLSQGRSWDALLGT